MADIVLTGNSNVSNIIIDSFMSMGIESDLTSHSDSITSINSIMINGVRCINCQLNQGKSSIKNGPKCFRPARFNKEENIIRCIIYKKTKVN